MAKGQKTGGRKAGTPNRITQALRQRLNEVLEGELNNLPMLFEEVAARDRLQFIIKLIPYIIPPVEHEDHVDEMNKINFFELVNQQILDTGKKSG